jgi:predicted Zn-dependent protease
MRQLGRSCTQPAASDPHTDEAWLVLGKALVMAKRLSEARDVLSSLVSRSPNPEANALLARVESSLEQLDEASRLAGVGLAAAGRGSAE